MMETCVSAVRNVHLVIRCNGREQLTWLCFNTSAQAGGTSPRPAAAVQISRYFKLHDIKHMFYGPYFF